VDASRHRKSDGHQHEDRGKNRNFFTGALLGELQAVQHASRLAGRLKADRVEGNE